MSGGLKETERGAPSPCAAVSEEIKSPFRSFDILNNLSYFAQRHLDSQLPVQGDAAFFFHPTDCRFERLCSALFRPSKLFLCRCRIDRLTHCIRLPLIFFFLRNFDRIFGDVGRVVLPLLDFHF
jgi:hypothetical protein